MSVDEMIPIDTSWCDPSYGFPGGMQVSEQAFLIDAKEASEIHCEAGTRIVIRPNTLRDKCGDPVQGKVEFKVKECYVMSEFFAEQLSTVCNGRLLESGGMVHIAATCRGEEVFLAEGETYDLLIPKKENLKGMKTFYGERAENGNMNWQVGTSALTRAEFEARNAASRDMVAKSEALDLIMTAVSVPPAVNRGLRILEESGDTTMLGTHFKSKFEPSEELSNYAARWGGISIKFELDTLEGKLHTFLIEDPKMPKELRKELLIYFQTLPPLDISAPGPFSQEFQYRTIRNNRRNKAVASALRTYRLRIITADSSLGYQAPQIDSFKDLDSLSTWYGNNYFVLVPTSFGWINCDRFTPSNNSVNMIVSLPEPHMQVCMIFGEWNSMVMGTVHEKTASFGSVPAGTPVKLIALEKNGFPSMSVLHTDVTHQVRMGQPEPVEFAEFMYELNHY
ncbi:MAG: hypothetical protein RL220_2022 [Bacteroidota bacterium]